MADVVEMEEEIAAGPGSAALTPSPLPEAAADPALSPAERQLRRMVVNSVRAPTSKQAYGAALDHLFAFATGGSLTPALLQEWKVSMVSTAPLLDQRPALGRQEASLGGPTQRHAQVEEATSFTDVPNVRQQETRLGNWLTREQTKKPSAVPDRSTGIT